MGGIAVGRVSLVGAGPGDAGLITLAGARRLGSADVVYYDALVSARTLRLCRAGSRLVPVGKRRGCVTLSQPAIIACMIRDARRGLKVVRLKGGDPFVFGRGGEEADSLQRAGVPFEIIPGVSSGIGVPGLAGIPLTHRGVASSVAFVTAHDLSASSSGRKGRERLRHLARGADTLVIFMGYKEIARVRKTLLLAGLRAETPVALIESGSFPDERVRRVPLRHLGSLRSEARETARARGPWLLVVGRTVAWSDRLRKQRPRPRRRHAARRHLTLSGAGVREMPSRRLGTPVDFPRTGAARTLMHSREGT
ncbi:MAG: uroporphyrinogen-III C-methyltransferase [Acidobacteriota bacterium]